MAAMAGGRLVCTVLLLLACMPGLARRLICWQAIVQCTQEADCGYAYSQYLEACSPVLSPHSTAHRRCPSHCIAALIQLNHTKGGPALEDCDCAMDDKCKATKRAIEPCMPRTSGGGASAGGGGGGATGGGGGAVMGCTEARRLCENDRRCHASLNRYLSKCGRLFNGVRCTDECRAVIEDMMQVPKALLLNDCVCDGLERPICESIKENMARLCFDSDMSNGGPASSGGSDYEYEDEDYEDELGQARDTSSHEDDKTRIVAGNSGDTATASLLLTAATAMLLLVITAAL